MAYAQYGECVLEKQNNDKTYRLFTVSVWKTNNNCNATRFSSLPHKNLGLPFQFG